MSLSFPALHINTCLEFYYHMYGRDIGALRVYQSVEANGHVHDKILWERRVEKDRLWHKALVTISGLRRGFKVCVLCFTGQAAFARKHKGLSNQKPALKLMHIWLPSDKPLPNSCTLDLQVTSRSQTHARANSKQHTAFKLTHDFQETSSSQTHAHLIYKREAALELTHTRIPSTRRLSDLWCQNQDQPNSPKLPKTSHERLRCILATAYGHGFAFYRAAKLIELVKYIRSCVTELGPRVDWTNRTFWARANATLG